MGYLIRKNWWIIGLILLLVIILIVAEKQQKEEKAYFDTLETSSKIYIGEETNSPEAEQQYVKDAVDELLMMANEVSYLSKYDFDNAPQDIEAFKQWGEPIKSDLTSLHIKLSNNRIHMKYSNDSFTPPKFQEINNRALSSLYDVQETKKVLFEAIDNYKINNIKEPAKRLFEQGEGLKNLADEIVKVSNYQQ
ncbi:hypothetical protein [Aneurinibacillus aneurinilyticus]|uniref:hypothetical protein n=1 Tax=Aneurinibacillus aneurinilyticus TaxID=1391 RepID=UPI00352447A8